MKRGEAAFWLAACAAVVVYCAVKYPEETKLMLKALSKEEGDSEEND